MGIFQAGVEWEGQSRGGKGVGGCRGHSYSGRHRDRLGKVLEVDKRVRTHTLSSILTVVKGMEVAGLHPMPTLLFPAHHT